MPWSQNDGPSRHTKKADTPALRKQWATVANKVLEESGGAKEAEGKAVRIANAAVANNWQARNARYGGAHRKDHAFGR